MDFTKTLKGVNGETAVYGIIGEPVNRSLSPAIQNAAFYAAGINACYMPFPVQPTFLKEAVLGLKAAGVKGFNITVPHKVAMLPLLDALDAVATQIGAVNTVRCEGSDRGETKLVGTNTDGAGFLWSLQVELQQEAEAERVLLLGAGGAARAIAMALLQADCSALCISNRSLGKAQQLQQHCLQYFPSADIQVVGGDQVQLSAFSPTVVVNATTVGTDGQSSPVALSELGSVQAVLDIIYTPLETPLLVQAKQRNIPCVNGIGMLLGQGAEAFRFWTAKNPPIDVMRSALEAFFAPSR